ncbi:hypothetical protein [Streptomyces sp. DASNCL29]|uniref:hypothetical protein n=1 Tax=Streptomyces sp. DASNCL29 TaxID=2583819 RepID=UPI00110F7F7F|nr:hypothetical protein [Streptomyces sp. DASNCL29]TMU99711.1 hypothetical protein FGK60_19655 [Streptomyces sp. DASNCL29]
MGRRRGRVVQGVLGVGVLLGALLGIPQQAHADPAPPQPTVCKVRTHTEPSIGSAVHSTFPGPTGIRVDCQRRAERVTSEGYSSDVWSHLPDDGGSWISNICLKGGAWQDGVPLCAPGNPPPGR